jgi:uncharacterized protein
MHSFSRSLKLLLSVACVLSGSVLFAQVKPLEKPFIWEIQGEKISYVFGTIHIPDDRVLALPNVVTDALNKSDAVYIEIDMSPENQVKLQKASVLSGTETLRDVLPAELLARAHKIIQTKGYPPKAFEKLKIWSFMSAILTLDYLKAMMTKTPQDLYFYKNGLERKKEVGGLETVEEQLGIFEGLSKEEQVQMLQETLDGLEKGNSIQKVIDLYLAGDIKELSNEINKDMHKADDLSKKLYRLALTERDARMAQRIESKIRDNPTKCYFFAVGAAHLAEKDNVIETLEKKGFKVNRVNSIPQQEVSRDNLSSRVKSRDPSELGSLTERSLDFARDDIDSFMSICVYSR